MAHRLLKQAEVIEIENINMDLATFGRRVRHYRKAAGFTLGDLGDKVGKPVPYLSTLETGKREPKLSLIQDVASALGVEVGDLMKEEAPSERDRLELLLIRQQSDPLYAELDLPPMTVSSKVSDEVLIHLTELFGRLQSERGLLPDAMRSATTRLRAEMAKQDNYLESIELVATETLAQTSYTGSGPVAQAQLEEMVAHHGFHTVRVNDLPKTTRSIADLENRIIYMPQRDLLRTRDARSVLLQTLAHFALDHTDPQDLDEFLRQRIEANYFAGAVLAPREAAVHYLAGAKQARNLSIEDLKEVFYISYQMAAHRFTNLATTQLDIPAHLVRSDEDGVIWQVYSNNDVPLPRAPDGSVEGQRLCKEWGTRAVFTSPDKYSIHYQYTDTENGTYWCSSHIIVDSAPLHAITVGTDFEHARFFRGRDTERHTVSRCPDGVCCRTPSPGLTDKWNGKAWPSVIGRSYAGAPVPGVFAGVDMVEIFEFLESQPLASLPPKTSVT